MYNTDGNLAALRQYERELDEAERADEALREAQDEAADALFDAYVTGNKEVVDEVDARLCEPEFDNCLADLCREYFNRPQKLHDEYRELIIRVADNIVDGLDYDQLERLLREYKL